MEHRVEKLAYTLDEAAAAVGLSRRSIYWAMEHGDLLAVKHRGRTLIRHKDLVAFVDNRLEPWTPGTRKGEHRACDSVEKTA